MGVGPLAQDIVGSISALIYRVTIFFQGNPDIIEWNVASLAKVGFLVDLEALRLLFFLVI